MICGTAEAKWPLRVGVVLSSSFVTLNSTSFLQELDQHTFIFIPFTRITQKMVRLSSVLVGAVAALSSFSNAASVVTDLIPSNFDKVVLQSGKPALVEFFAPWCGHCKTLAPIYEELAQVFAHAENKVTVGKVDADEHRELGKRFGVQGFPTLKWFDGKSDKPEEYKGGRDLESLSSWITDKTGIKPRGAQKEASKVEFLNDANFKTTIGGEKDVLVAFTAPWCGREFQPFLCSYESLYRCAVG
jgi:protein disulfide-isomerase A6